MGRIVLSQAKDINHGKDCSITSERYKSWEGLFYHKRKIHNCEDAHSSRYELKHAVKPLEEKACKCMCCPRRLRKVTMEELYLKERRGNFTWVKCELCCREHREEEFRGHIKEHNIYFRGEYNMKTEKLEHNIYSKGEYNMKTEKLEHNIYSRGEYNMKTEKLEHNIYFRSEYNMKTEKLEHNIYSKGEYNMKTEKLEHNIYFRSEYNMKTEKLEHNIYSKGEYNMKTEKLEHNIYFRSEYNMKTEKLEHNIYSTR